ncbi:hypothetical protein CUMW_256670, partial [Citrus unshiu]
RISLPRNLNIPSTLTLCRKDKFPRHTSLTSLKSLETYKLNNFG